MQYFFNKYHGTGNDFIIIDNRKRVFNKNNTGLIKLLCDRHFGIGADGLILIYNHEEYDFEMKYFNADGKESSMCGNGGRCAVAFAIKEKTGNNSGSFLAADGIHRYNIKENAVSISLNDTEAPVFINDNHFLNTGSPHYIIKVPEADKVDVLKNGRALRNSDAFSPNGTNVNYLEYQENSIYVRTYEKGVENETLSCGTGVTAAAISSVWGSGPGVYSINVKTKGGKLKVDFRINEDKITDICLSGPAEFVFEGVINQ